MTRDNVVVSVPRKKATAVRVGTSMYDSPKLAVASIAQLSLRSAGHAWIRVVLPG